MKIAVLTTVLGRPNSTLAQMKWMGQVKRHFSTRQLAEITPFYVLSTYDPHTDTFIEEIMRQGHYFVNLPHEVLSTKTQYGLWCLKEAHDIDYLVHCDSDEFLSMTAWEKLLGYMKNGVDWVAIKDQIFWCPEDETAWLFTGYTRHPFVNAGNTISRAILDACYWYVWSPGLHAGLNVHEVIRYKNKGFSPTILSMKTRGALEIKEAGEDSIHPMSWYREEGYELRPIVGKEKETLMCYHPYLIQLEESRK